MKKKKISIISPIYNSSKIIEKFVKAVIKNLKKITNIYEIILIDDHSTDDSWKELMNLKNKYKNLIIKKNKKNLGQHQTIRKALKISEGEIVFILDCDLQDNPIYFNKFYNMHSLNGDAIIGLISNTNNFNKGIISKIFWNILNFFSKIDFPSNITNFTLISSSQVKKIISLKKVGFLYGDICRAKIKIQFIKFNRSSRVLGKSSYNFFKLIKLSFIWFYIYAIN